MKIKRLNILLISCLVPFIAGCASSTVSLLEDGTVVFTYEALAIRGDAESAAEEVKETLKKICKGFIVGSIEEKEAGVTLSRVLDAHSELQNAVSNLQQTESELLEARNRLEIQSESASEQQAEIDSLEDLKKNLENTVKEKQTALKSAVDQFTTELIAGTAGITDQIVKSVKNRTVVAVASNCVLWNLE